MIISQKWREFKLAEDVTVELKPLSVAHYHKTLALIMRHKSADSFDGESKLNPEKLIVDPELIEILSEILPANVRNIKNLQIEMADGEMRDGKPDDFHETGALLMSAVKLLGELIRISQITGIEEKN